MINQPTTGTYPLSLHDALPICSTRSRARSSLRMGRAAPPLSCARPPPRSRDRKSTRLNSSHLVISYAVFCLKKTKGVQLLHPFFQLLNSEVNFLTSLPHHITCN